MPYMTAYRRGDIVLVPFPFSDQTTVKKRPAIIISSSQYNTTSQDIIIIAVTSRIDRLLDLGECTIQNWKEAGLLKPSRIKPALSTIEQKLVLKTLGTLSAGDLTSLSAVLKDLLEL
jgi:mRNA interferase MazF